MPAKRLGFFDDWATVYRLGSVGVAMPAKRLGFFDDDLQR